MALTTTLIAPRLQHRFWIRQQKFDLCMANLHQLHRLSSEFYQYIVCLDKEFIQAKRDGNKRAFPREDDREFYRRFYIDWRSITNETKFLFSADTHDSIVDWTISMMDMLTEPLEKSEWSVRIDRFDSCDDSAFQALYSDLGLLKHKRKWFAALRSAWPAKDAISITPDRPKSPDLTPNQHNLR